MTPFEQSDHLSRKILWWGKLHQRITLTLMSTCILTIVCAALSVFDVLPDEISRKLAGLSIVSALVLLAATFVTVSRLSSLINRRLRMNMEETE